MDSSKYVCVYAYICVCVCIYVCLHVCMCIYVTTLSFNRHHELISLSIIQINHYINHENSFLLHKFLECWEYPFNNYFSILVKFALNLFNRELEENAGIGEFDIAEYYRLHLGVERIR